MGEWEVMKLGRIEAKAARDEMGGSGLIMKQVHPTMLSCCLLASFVCCDVYDGAEDADGGGRRFCQVW